MTPETIRYLLHVGRALVLFDGLDEVLKIDERHAVADKIWRFADAFPSSSYVVTSRLVGYNEVPVSAFPFEWEVRPFDNSRIESYCEWFFEQHSHSAEPQARASDFMRDSRGIPDLRANPLLLGVLCALFAQGRRLPRNRSNLYLKCAEMLFEEWDALKGTTVSVDDQDSTADAIREIALRTFMSGVEEISEESLTQQLESYYKRERRGGRAESRRFAKQALNLWRGRQWVLVFAGEHEDEVFFRFAHRSFLEYFAAEQLVFECADGRGLWDALREFVETRTAVQFTLLCIEMLARKTRHSVDAFLSLALEEVAELEDIGAFSTHLLCAEALAVTRGEPSLRLAVARSMVGELARVLPASSIGELTATGYSGNAYQDLFNSAYDWELGDIDSEDESRAQLGFGAPYRGPGSASEIGLAHEDAGLLLLALSNVSKPEREQLLAAVMDSVVKLASSEVAAAARVSIFLLQLPHVESWEQVDADFRVYCIRAATGVWALVQQQLRPEHLVSLDGYVLIQYVRGWGQFWPQACQVLGARGLF